MTNSTTILCDACGLTASPLHIAERVQRLERATRFRPVHIEVLFVGHDPAARVEDDFYGPPESLELFDSLFNSLLNSVDIRESAESNPAESCAARLLEAGGFPILAAVCYPCHPQSDRNLAICNRGRSPVDLGKRRPVLACPRSYFLLHPRAP